MQHLLHIPRDWRRPDCPESWDLWWSEAAQFGAIHPRPGPAQIAAAYDVERYYTHQAPPRTPRPGWPARLAAALAARLDHGLEPDAAFWRRTVPSHARHAVELGCGNGDRMVQLAPYLSEIVGMEPDPKAAAVARAKGLEVLDGTAEALPPELAARRFDFVLFTHVLEHCLDPMLALRNAAGLLADDGVLMLETPNNHAKGFRRYGASWRWVDVPRHLNFFTESSLRACARAAGLVVVRSEYWGYCRQFLPDWIAEQALIEARLSDDASATPRIRAWEWRALDMLARTAFAAPARKYDSVRLICRRG
ncbi:MAG: class I SAM-dependent methyltransferase [Pararhodobacter sp.]